MLAPTRELALQVVRGGHPLRRAASARGSLTVYGGAPVGPQWKALQEGVDVVVATPGRAIDLMNRGALRLDELEIVVLDEADEMLDMGFVEDIETLLDADPGHPPGRAVLARRCRAASRRSRSKYLREPVTVRIRREEVPEGEAPQVRQTAYLVPRTHTTAALGRVLEAERPRAAIVFCRTRLDVDAVTETLTARGLRAEALHGGMDQEHRTRVVDRLRSGRTELLVATDVAARGLDIDLLTHVVNHDVPQSPETYVHRIGRVGRAGPRGRRDHAGAAVEDVRAAQRRAAHRPADRDRARSRRPPTCAPPGSTAPATRWRRRSARSTTRTGRTSTTSAPCSPGSPPSIDLARRRHGRRPADAGGRRCARRRRGHPRRHRPAARAASASERPASRARWRAAGTRPPKAGMTRLFVNAGRAGGVRPQDIVGALANESNLSGRDIGAIQIHERHSLVEVPEHAADDVLRSLRGEHHAQGPPGQRPPRPRLRSDRRPPPRRPPGLIAGLAP